MIIILLLVIIAILLFGAAIVRSAMLKMLLLALAAIPTLPLLLKLLQNPLALAGLAVLLVFLGGIAALWKANDEHRALNDVWQRYEDSIKNDFSEEQISKLRQLRNAGDLKGLRIACYDYKSAADKRKKAVVPLTKEQKSYLKSRYLMEQKRLKQ